MTRQEFVILTKPMKKIYKGTFDDDDVMELWYRLLKQYPYEIVSAAVQMHLETCVYEPKPASIIENIKKIMPKEEKMTGQEAWALVRKAISNGTYGAEEEFNKLPPMLQRCVGHPSRLREMAGDADFSEGVESSNFIRSYTELVKRQEEYEKLPDNVKALIERGESLETHDMQQGTLPVL